MKASAVKKIGECILKTNQLFDEVLADILGNADKFSISYHYRIGWSNKNRAINRKIDYIIEARDIFRKMGYDVFTMHGSSMIAYDSPPAFGVSISWRK